VGETPTFALADEVAQIVTDAARDADAVVEVCLEFAASVAETSKGQKAAARRAEFCRT